MFRRVASMSLSSNGASYPSAAATLRLSSWRRSATCAVGGVRITSVSWRPHSHGTIPEWSRWEWLTNTRSTGGAFIGYWGGSRGSIP